MFVCECVSLYFVLSVRLFFVFNFIYMKKEKKIHIAGKITNPPKKPKDF